MIYTDHEPRGGNTLNRKFIAQWNDWEIPEEMTGLDYNLTDAEKVEIAIKNIRNGWTNFQIRKSLFIWKRKGE